MPPLSHFQICPRSITDRSYWKGLRQRPHLAPIITAVEQAARTLPSQPEMPAATDYLAAKRSNDRSRTDRLWQTGRAGLSMLAINRCLLGLDDADGDDRLLDWLWAHLTHPTWTVSAHLPSMDLPAAGKPVLDLASCEMAAVLAEMRECLKPWMDGVSATLADSIVHEIDRRILTPYADGFEVWWDHPGRVNNWLGVCAGNILAACESLAAQGHPRPKARQRSVEGLRLFLEAGFTEHGECDEGLGYWAYGVGQLVVGLSRLPEAEFRAQFDLDRLRLIAEYPRRIHLHGDLFFSGNDAGLRGRAGMSYVPWLAAACGSEWLAGWAAGSPTPDARNFPMLIRALSTPQFAAESDAMRQTDATQYLADQQVVILRRPTPRGQLIVCLTGGHNAERHNHNDLGHFIVALDDLVVMPDLGAPHYTADFFSGNRYSYLSASSRGHSCPIINGAEQRDGRDAQAKVLEWSADADQPRFTLDLTAAYPPEAGLDRWTRSLERSPAGFVVRDVYRTRRPATPITHVLWSTQPIDLRHDHGGIAVARMGPLSCALAPAAGDAQVEPIDPAAHRLRDYKDTLYRLSATYPTDVRGELTVETRLEIEQP